MRTVTEALEGKKDLTLILECPFCETSFPINLEHPSELVIFNALKGRPLAVMNGRQRMTRHHKDRVTTKYNIIEGIILL